MTRTLSLLAALAPLAAGCIIYEERHPRGGPCGPDEDCTVTSPVPDEETPVDPTPDPEPEEPSLTDDLVLSVNEAFPGQSVLSTLTPISQEIDLSNVVSLSFERDVAVLDTIVRPFEIVLLLAVDAEAELGDVEVFVETTQGAGFILAEPFHIVAADGSDPACTPGTTTDTGSQTDTGCP